MKLATYLKLHAIKQVAFAEKIGVSEAMVSRLASGDRKPSLDTMQAIAFATGGAVRPDDWLEVTEAKDG